MWSCAKSHIIQEPRRRWYSGFCCWLDFPMRWHKCVQIEMLGIVSVLSLVFPSAFSYSELDSILAKILNWGVRISTETRNKLFSYHYYSRSLWGEENLKNSFHVNSVDLYVSGPKTWINSSNRTPNNANMSDISIIFVCLILIIPVNSGKSCHQKDWRLTLCKLLVIIFYPGRKKKNCPIF